MSDINVFGRLTSANVQKVIWVLEELELPYDHENLGGRYGGLSDPAYLAMNPNGLVPVLRDGALVLWESHAIVRYLSAEYADGLLFPSTPRDRAVVDQWTDWTATRWQQAWIGLFWATYRTKPENRKPADISRARDEVARCLAILDQRLSRVPYLAGDTLTYADIVAGIGLYRNTTVGSEPALPPGVAAWHARLRERPAYRKAVEVDYSELKATF